MAIRLDTIRHSLGAKLILMVGLTLLVTISAWALFNIEYQKEKLMENVLAATDRLTNTIRLGTHYAMMLNSRDDINQITMNIARQPDIENIRIYNKEGIIKFSNQADEVDQITNIKNEACDICHRTDPPLMNLSLSARTRIFSSLQGHRLLGIISPIYNESGCASDACHVHPADKKILGALDVVVSLAQTDREILGLEKGLILLACLVFLVTSTMIVLFVLRFVNRPVKKLIDGTRRIARGEYASTLGIDSGDELGHLAEAVNQMSGEIGKKQQELNRQRDEYQNLFEQVPCLITVQDRTYRLLRYNQEFAERFDPEPGDFCYHAYKGRREKCVNCPVERTFLDGRSHYGEETGVNKDGSPAHWLFKTSPIRNADGEIVAAMEISLDITQRKFLEVELEKSEKKYYGIFDNIPNPVFVLDADSFLVLDCNASVTAVYGYAKKEMTGRTFLDLFKADERDYFAFKLTTSSIINQVKHIRQDGRELYVNIRISPTEFPGQKALLVTTSDITKRLEAEQQLIQGSKMATLGEMATGVAHELNQPLSVIKTASSFCMKKINRNEPINEKILFSMLEKVDSNVDRASKIIHHIRTFARKTELKLSPVQLNEVLANAFEIFSQQLKVRGIEVIWELDPALPKIKGDAGRLEQVFINLILNARDAIEEKWVGQDTVPGNKRITLRTCLADDRHVVAEVLDTGPGIPSSRINKIFEPFYTTKEVGKGTGLGLSISYGIVKDCNGDIRAESMPGGGACFRLVFPALSAGAEQNAS